MYNFTEEETTPNAELLVLKGYQNIVSLNGGLRKFTAMFPELIEGEDIPEIVLTPKSFIKRKNPDDFKTTTYQIEFK